MPMTPADMEALPKGVEQHMEELAAAVLAEIIERVKDGREITSTTDYLIYRYNCIKGFTAAVKQHIQAAIEASEAEIDRIFDDVLKEEYVRDATIYRELANREITPFASNKELQQYIRAVKAQTKETFENITQTTGYMVKNNGKLQMTPPAAVLQRSLDKAIGQVLEGTETYNNAIRDVVKELTDSDLRTVQYDSGKTYDVASAARMCLMTGVTQVTARIAEQNMRELGTEYVQVSWHATARPSHQKWQGRIFHWKGFLKLSNCVDVTERWIQGAVPDSHPVKEMLEYVVDGVPYKVDDRNVVMRPSSREREIAALLENQLGGELFLVPRVLNPKGISTPDYIFQGKRFDLKEFSGESEHLVYNAISKKRRQADNFILDFSKCLLSEADIYRQINDIYRSSHTRFVNDLIIIKNNNILRIVSRK